MNIEGIPAGNDVPAHSILLVDDEENILASLRRLLRRDGYRILCASSGQAGLEILKQEKVDVIVSDQRMPQMTGTVFLHHARDLSPDSIRIILSGYTDLASVTDAINEGAVYKFLTKPWDDEILRLSLKEALRHKWIADENRMLHGMLVEVNEELASANQRLARQAEFAQDALNTHQDIIEAIPIPLLGLDPDGRLMLVNRSALTQLSSLSLHIGSFAREFLPQDLSPLFKGISAPVSVVIGDRLYAVSRSNLPHENQGWILCFIAESSTLRPESGTSSC